MLLVGIVVLMFGFGLIVLVYFCVCLLFSLVVLICWDLFIVYL